MIDQHLGRRSVSDFQRGVLALRKREIVADRRARFLVSSNQEQTASGIDVPVEILPWEERLTVPIFIHCPRVAQKS